MRQYVNQKSRQEFIHLIMKHASLLQGTELDLHKTAKRLMRYGATYGRIQEDACNGPDFVYGNDALNNQRQYMWEQRRAQDAKKEARIEAKVTELCATIGCKPIFQGDPRGNTIKIQMSDGFTNDWGNDGVCVPTS